MNAFEQIPPEKQTPAVNNRDLRKTEQQHRVDTRLRRRSLQPTLTSNMCRITHTYGFCPCLNYACNAPPVKFELQPEEGLQGRIRKGHYIDERIELSRCDDREYELLNNKRADGSSQCEKVHVQIFDLKESRCSHCERKNCGRIVLDQHPKSSTPPEESKPRRSSMFSKIFRRAKYY